MRLFIPGDFTDTADIDALRARAVALDVFPDVGPVYESSGLVVRFRFLHELPEGPLAIRPPLPEHPDIPTLVAAWSQALSGAVWRSPGQIAVIHAAREWARVTAVEVSL